ncbi:MAG: peptidoglycan DD-metalloendopeptidase family protein [Acidimicrobiia bacterium]
MRNRIVLVTALVIALAVPAYAQAAGQITPQDIDAALEQRRRASASLEVMTGRFEQAMADEEILRERISSLARSVAELEQEISDRRIEVQDIVRSRYMAGGSLGTERVFTARNFTDIPVQTEYFELINTKDISVLRGLEAAEALHVENQAKLDQALVDQEDLVVELTALAADLGEALADADSEYTEIVLAFEKQEEERRLREEAERKRLEELQRAAAAAATEAAATTTTTTVVAETTTTTVASTSESTTTTSAETTTTQAATTSTTAPPATATTTTTIPPPPIVTEGKTCPVNAAVSFSNTWGDPRSGGRTHKGVDMVASRNAPIVAIEAGVVTRTSDSSLGGLSVYLTGDSGSSYYYAHLEYIEAGIGSGSIVGVGALLGGNGSTGNAPDWLPHLHFQYAPPGYDWINPYPLVKALCG